MHLLCACVCGEERTHARGWVTCACACAGVGWVRIAATHLRAPQPSDARPSSPWRGEPHVTGSRWHTAELFDQKRQRRVHFVRRLDLRDVVQIERECRTVGMGATAVSSIPSAITTGHGTSLVCSCPSLAPGVPFLSKVAFLSPKIDRKKLTSEFARTLDEATRFSSRGVQK